jgi:hypothetical protein
MHRQPGRLSSLAADALARDSYIICHDTLTYGPHPTCGPAICREFHDVYPPPQPRHPPDVRPQ